MRNEHIPFLRIKLDLLLLVLVAVIFAGICIFHADTAENSAPSLNEVRVEYKDAVVYAEQQNYTQLMKYPCICIDTSSNVVFSTVDTYKTGTMINLHTLSSLASKDESGQYIVPLMNGNNQTGTLVLFYDINSSAGSTDFILYALLLICSALLSLRILYLLKKTVTEPVKTMSVLTDAILKYDYTEHQTDCDRSELEALFTRLELIRYELQRAAEKEKAMKQREENMLACISHDLKTPISTINGCAECIRDGVAKSPESLKNYSATIISKSLLLTKMINSIISNSSMSMNDFTIQQKEVYLKDYLIRIIDDLSPDLHQCSLSWDIGQIDNLLVSIDPDLIYQVIQNIVGNSIKYTRPGGVISIRTKELRDRHSVMIEITDTGEGISAEDIPFVFDRFFRSEKARSQNIPGNGLGLSIVKSIISLHGGIVECESILGKGTTIVFSIPLA